MKDRIIYIDELYRKEDPVRPEEEEIQEMHFQMVNGIHSDINYEACLMCSVDW